MGRTLYGLILGLLVWRSDRGGRRTSRSSCWATNWRFYDVRTRDRLSETMTGLCWVRSPRRCLAGFATGGSSPLRPCWGGTAHGWPVTGPTRRDARGGHPPQR